MRCLDCGYNITPDEVDEHEGHEIMEGFFEEVSNGTDIGRTSPKPKAEGNFDQKEKKEEGMKIGKKWEIKSDELNVTLYERFVAKKTGKEGWKAHSFYANTANALKALVDIEVNRTGLEDLKTVVKKIGELKELITKAIQSETLTKKPTIGNTTTETTGKGKSSKGG